MKLTILSNDVIDWNGQWTKEDVEKEVREIGFDMSPESFNWLEWIIDHVFPNDELKADIYNAIVKHDEVKRISLDLADGQVAIIKSW